MAIPVMMVWVQEYLLVAEVQGDITEDELDYDLRIRH